MSRRIATKDEMPLREGKEKKVRFRTMDGGQDTSKVKKIIDERLELVKGMVIVRKDGTKVLGTEAFSAFIDEPLATIKSRMLKQNNGRYTHDFLDEEMEVEILKGSKGRREFSLNDAIKLLEAKIRKEDELILVPRIAEEIGLSPSWIFKIFCNKGERMEKGYQMEIEIENKRYTLRLFRVGKGIIPRMRKEDYKIFVRWVEITYKEERTWKPDKEKIEVPEGKVTTGQAARILGYSKSDIILEKIRIGKIKGELLEDGRTVIDWKDVLEYKGRKDKSAPPKNSMLFPDLCRRIGLSKSQAYKMRKKVNEDNEYFEVKDHLNEAKRFRIYRDIDDHLWILEEDGKEVEKISEERKQELLTTEDSAKILGIMPHMLVRYSIAGKQISRIPLIDGSSIDIRYTCTASQNLYHRGDVENAKATMDYLKVCVKLIPEIASRVGIGKNKILRLINANNAVFKFTLNRQEYEIEIKKGKRGIIYLYEHELEPLARYLKMKNQRSHWKLNGNHMGRNRYRRERIYALYNEKAREIVLYQKSDIKIAVPVEELNGELYLKKEHAELIDFHIEINNRLLDKRIKALKQLSSEIKKAEKYNKIKLLILKDRRSIENDLLIRPPQPNPEKNVLCPSRSSASEGGRGFMAEEQIFEKCAPPRTEVRGFRPSHFSNDKKLLMEIEELLGTDEVKKIMSEKIEDLEMTIYRNTLMNSSFAKEYGIKDAIRKISEEEKVLILSHDYGIVIPISGNNGDVMMDERDAGLVELYEKLFHSDNGENFTAAFEYLRTMNGLDSTTNAGLWMIREFLINLDSERTRSYDAQLLYDLLSEGRFLKIWAKGMPISGRYSARNYKIPMWGLYGMEEPNGEVGNLSYDQLVMYSGHMMDLS